MFSLEKSARLQRFWTPADDAFAQDWASVVGWIHPPYSMGERVLNKILATSSFTGAVCLPDWPSQDWYTKMHQICTTFRNLDTRDGTFLLHGETPMARPNWNITVFYFVDYVPTDIDMTPASAEDPAHVHALITCASQIDLDIAQRYLEKFPINRIFVRTITCTEAERSTPSRQLRALYDDGAERSLVSAEWIRTNFPDSQRLHSDLHFAAFDAHATDSKGAILLTINAGTTDRPTTITYPFAILDLVSEYDMLIGRDILQQFDYVSDVKRRVINLRSDDGTTTTLDAPNIHIDRPGAVFSSTVDDIPNLVDDDSDLTNPSPDLHQDGENFNYVQFREYRVDCGALADDLKPEFAALLEEFADVFDVSTKLRLPPSTAYDMKIVLKDPNKIHYGQPIPLPKPYNDWLREQYQKRIDAGCIYPSTNCPYSSRSFVIPKKIKGKFREVTDYRQLNENTVADKFPLPRIDQLLDELADSKRMSAMDLLNGFYSNRMDPDSEDLVASMTPDGQFSWRVMPQGLKNAPPVFQHKNADHFSRQIFTLKELLLYIDDLLAKSATDREHLECLRRVFETCRLHALRLNLAKCIFFQVSLRWLGHVVGHGSISPDPDLISAIEEYPQPTTLKALRGFLGLANYYRRFVPHMASVASPLYDFLRSDAPSLTSGWGEKHDDSFLTLKRLLTSEPCLKIYDHDRDTEIHTDASQIGIGGVLMQKHNDDWHPCMYFSHRMTGAQLNYSTTEQEFLAIVTALQKWKAYLLGKPFVIRTDHKACTYYQNKSGAKLSLRETRWLDTVSQFDCTFEHVEGKSNVVPDALSRGALVSAVINNSVQKGLDLTDGRSRQNESLRKRILDVAEYQQMLNNVPNGFVIHDGLLYYEKLDDYSMGRRLYIPDDATLRNEVLESCHDAPFAGHMGRDRTLSLLTRHYYWPGMSRDVAEYVRTCPTCQMANPTTKQQTPSLKPIDPAGGPFLEMTVDFLKMPMTLDGFDYLLVCVDRFSKYGIFIPTVSTIDGLEAGKLFQRDVVRYFGVPTRIISDRGPNLVQGFWPQFVKAMGSSSSYTTAYHPQGNGQTERMNRTLLGILRRYCSEYPENWSNYIDTAQFAYNNGPSDATGYTPFYVNLLRHPRMPLWLEPYWTTEECSLDDKLATQFGQRRKVYDLIYNALCESNARMKKQADKTRSDRTLDSEFVKLRTGLESTRDKNKLDPFWSGPFRVLKVNSDSNTVELKLPEKSRAHPVFNYDKVAEYHPSDSERFPKRARSAPEPSMVPSDKLDPTRHEIQIIHFRDWSTVATTGYPRYFVTWSGYDSNASEAQGYADETEDTVEVFQQLEKSYGVFPERGHLKRLQPKIRQHLLKRYQHKFPITVNTPQEVSSLRDRTRKRASSKKIDNELMNLVVEELRDVSDADYAEHTRGLVHSFDAKANVYKIWWTDGSTSTMTPLVVIKSLLSAEPVSLVDDDDDTGS